MSALELWWLSALTASGVIQWVMLTSLLSGSGQQASDNEEARRELRDGVSAQWTHIVKNAENIVAISKLQGETLQALTGKKPAA